MLLPQSRVEQSLRRAEGSRARLGTVKGRLLCHKVNTPRVHRLPMHGLWPGSNYFGTKIKQAAGLLVRIFL